MHSRWGLLLFLFFLYCLLDRVMQRKRLEFADANSSKALARLNDSLAEVSGIMRQNIEEILQRGENLSGIESLRITNTNHNKNKNNK